MAYCFFFLLVFRSPFFSYYELEGFFPNISLPIFLRLQCISKEGGGRPGKIACAIHGYNWQRHGIVDGTKCPLAATPHSFSVGADLFP